MTCFSGVFMLWRSMLVFLSSERDVDAHIGYMLAVHNGTCVSFVYMKYRCCLDASTHTYGMMHQHGALVGSA